MPISRTIDCFELFAFLACVCYTKDDRRTTGYVVYNRDLANRISKVGLPAGVRDPVGDISDA